MTQVAPDLIEPALAGGEPPPAQTLPFIKRFRGGSGARFAILPAAVYEQPIRAEDWILGRILFVSHPDGIRRILIDNVANYPKREFDNRIFSAMFGEGLLSSEGEHWRAHRRVMAPAFDPRSVQAYARTMSETSAAFRARWDRMPINSSVDIGEEMAALTLQIICQAMFSSDAAELIDLTGDALEQTQAALNFNILDILPIIGPMRMRRKRDAIRADFSRMDAAVYRLIAAREAAGADGPKDLLARLIAAKDPVGGAGLTPSEVRDEVLTIFMAGHETTAVAMTWIWYLLSQHPAVERKLHAELDEVLGDRLPTPEDLPDLTYARMVIEEAMRLYPPAPALSTRIAQEPDEICGVKVPAKGAVIVSPWVLHRHKTLWENPGRFDPERFSPERSAERPRFAYLPFGAGPRVCIGAVLAMTEATLILAVLAQRYRPQLAPGQTVELRPQITLRPRGGIRMILERR